MLTVEAILASFGQVFSAGVSKYLVKVEKPLAYFIFDSNASTIKPYAGNPRTFKRESGHRVLTSRSYNPLRIVLPESLKLLDKHET